jgi:hypothetical protein
MADIYPRLLTKQPLDDTLGNAQHIWNVKPGNLEKFFLVSLLSARFQLNTNRYFRYAG